MANNLLTSLTAASRAHSHIVFNERTQEFERAGKRHAIASFFGSADARAKNDLTLQKIKEALNAEAADGVRFGGYGKVADGIFARVDVDRRIKSSTINAIIRSFRQESASAPDRLGEMTELTAQMNHLYQVICPPPRYSLDEATERLAESLKNENEFMVVLDSPRFEKVTFYSQDGRGSSGRIEESERHSRDISSILEMYCGGEGQEQVVTALSCMATAARQVLLPHFISNGAENRSVVFNPLYTVNVEESGDLELKISNLPGSAITLDWAITIHPDGTHSATDPIVGAQ